MDELEKARQLRLAVVQNVYDQNLISEHEARSLLDGNLVPEDNTTYFDDSRRLTISDNGFNDPTELKLKQFKSIVEELKQMQDKRDIEEAMKMMAKIENDTISFSTREWGLIYNSIQYAENGFGLPGHNLMVIIAKLCELAGISETKALSNSKEVSRD